MQINKWKIFGYTVVTWFLFSVLARIIFEMAHQSGGYISIVSCQGAVWGWMSLFMGIYLATQFKKWIELVWGVVLFFICTLPVIGMFIGIGYFARAYVKLEKARWGEGVADAQSTLDEFTAEVIQSKEEERKAREVTEHGDKEKAVQEEAHTAWILAVVLVLGAVLAGYWAFAPNSADAPELIETPTPNVERTPDIAQVSSQTPTPSADLEKTITNSIGMEFVLIPAGEFVMGSSPSCSDEKPVHNVTIEKAFYVGKYEVTQKQWQEVMGSNPSYFKGDDLPVERVFWNDVQEFIKKLNEKEGTDKYRLPSEAEWEYACRAGTTTRYSFGDSESKLGDYAWYGDYPGGKTHSVGTKKPNPWGLYDIHGNVYEWTQDYWHSDYNGAPTDGSVWSGDGAARVVRGGSWYHDAGGCRSAGRSHDGPGRIFAAPGSRSYNIGFRLLKEM
jgi:formylglycine-generating enzyme required for sulfatase activity